jgi:acyl carrier protein
MNTNDIRATALRLLSNIAPEADPAALKPDISFRDQLDIDSVDLLNFLISLHKEFGVEIPERDYDKLMTVNSCVSYLEKAIAGKSGS